MPGVRSGWSGRVVRLLLLSVVGLLVVSLGTVVAGRDERPTPAPPSRSDIALANASSAAVDLHKRAGRLAATFKGNAETQAALSTAVSTLERHRRLLTPGGTVSSSPAPTSAAGQAAVAPSSAHPAPLAPSVTPGASSTPQPADLASLVGALAHFGRAALDDAADTTAGVARTLAMAGTEQLAMADALADAASLPAPQLPAAPVLSAEVGQRNCTKAAAAPVTGPAPETTAAGSAASPGPKQEVRALQSMVGGLQRALYAYETAAARLPDKAASFATARLERHQQALEAGLQLLEAGCGHIPVAEPAYELPRTFRKSPADGLAAVEEDLADMYLDLTGLSDGAIRQWAIGKLPRTSLAARHWEKP